MVHHQLTTTCSPRAAKTRLKWRRYKSSRQTRRGRRRLRWCWRKIWLTLQRVGSHLSNLSNRPAEEAARRSGRVREKSHRSSLERRWSWRRRRARWNPCLSRTRPERLVSRRSRRGQGASLACWEEVLRWLRRRNKHLIEEKGTPWEFQEGQNQLRSQTPTHLWILLILRKDTNKVLWLGFTSLSKSFMR